MTDDEPNIVTSGKSQRVVVDGYVFSIEIYRGEIEKTWTLEVVDHEGTSHVWDEQFATDRDARNAALEALESEGAIAFMRGNNVIPFRGNNIVPFGRSLCCSEPVSAVRVSRSVRVYLPWPTA